MYRVTADDGDVYHVLESQFCGQWFWVVTAYGELTAEVDLGLHATKRDALVALSAYKGE